MPTCILRSVGLLAAAVSFLAPSAWAESGPTAGSGNRRAAYVQAGFSTAAPHLGGAAGGGAVALRLSRRLALEGSAAYLDRGSGASAAAFSADLILDFAGPEETAVPYLTLGGGVYRAAFDTRDPRFSGPAASGPMGTGRYRHVMKGGTPGWDLGQLPPFYGDRVEAALASDGRREALSFNDPALALGAGVRTRLGRAWSLRQDMRAQLVARNGHVYAVGIFTLQLGHGF